MYCEPYLSATEPARSEDQRHQFFARQLGSANPGLIPVAVAPLVGHAFSPFLRFRGGKGVTVTFGIWSGLLPGSAPAILGLALVIFKLVLRLRSHALCVLLGMTTLTTFLIIFHPLPMLLSCARLNTAILVARHAPVLHDR